MEKAFITFWICLAVVIVTVVGCITYHNVTLSADNDARLACIKARGDWTAWTNTCAFPKGSQ